jgi:hypothetical protein
MYCQMFSTGLSSRARDGNRIDPPPSHHAVHLPIGASVDDRREFGLLIGRQPRSRTTGPVVQQTAGASLIEAMNPVPQGLSIHPADPGCVGAVHPVQNRRQRQQPTTLVVVLRPLRRSPKLAGRNIYSQAHR